MPILRIEKLARVPVCLSTENIKHEREKEEKGSKIAIPNPPYEYFRRRKIDYKRVNKEYNNKI